MPYPRIELIKIENSGYLGTTVKIIIRFNLATANTARITIIGPYGDTKVDDANMTNDSDYMYSYLYQSTEGGDAGTYTAVMELISGSYLVMKEQNFELAQSALE